MRLRHRAALAAAGLVALWVGWGAYVTRHTDRVPYETVARLDGVELRRYPETVRVETRAATTGAAFRRLFRYLSGANEGDDEAGGGAAVAMTAPVRTVRREGAAVAMTAPVRTRLAGSEVTMAFYLPEDYTPATAPAPTDPDVELVVEPARTIAVRRFSWYATPGRTASHERALLAALRAAELEPAGEPFLLQYNDPWTPPFMRRNEVAVEVAAADVD